MPTLRDSCRMGIDHHGFSREEDDTPRRSPPCFLTAITPTVWIQSSWISTSWCLAARLIRALMVSTSSLVYLAALSAWLM